MKNAAFKYTFKLFLLSSLMMQVNLVSAVTTTDGDLVECMPGLTLADDLSRPISAGPSLLAKRLSCARENAYLQELRITNLEVACSDRLNCGNNKTFSSAMTYDLLGNFIIKKRLEDEMPRSMVYGAVKELLKKANAFDAKDINEQGYVNHKCVTNEFSLKESIDKSGADNRRTECNVGRFEEVARPLYKKCGNKVDCFGSLDQILKKDNDNSLTISSQNAEDFIDKNAKKILKHYNDSSKQEDVYIEQIRLALQTSSNVKEVLGQFKELDPVIMAISMPGTDKAKLNIDENLKPILDKELAALNLAKTKSAKEFKDAFKSFQIKVGRGLFNPCLSAINDSKKFIPLNAYRICRYGSAIAAGNNLKYLDINEYSGSALTGLLEDLSLSQTGSSKPTVETLDLVCQIKKTIAFEKARGDSNKSNTNLSKKGLSAGDIGQDRSNSGFSSLINGEGSSDSSYASNSALDSDLDKALINQAAASFGNSDGDKIDENAVIQANNQNLRGQNEIDKSSFMNNFAPVDNYSGIANDFVNKSYISRTDKKVAEKDSSDTSLNKQYSDIEAKIAEAEFRLKELQQGMGDVSKAGKNQPVVSNGAGKDKLQTSSEMEELLKEIKELKAQNNEIKDKLAAKAVAEKAEKEVAKTHGNTSNNNTPYAFSSSAKNDYKYETKAPDIKAANNYATSGSSSQAMRAPSSLSGAKMAPASSGALLSAIDNKAEAVNRVVTKVDNFNSESARKAITSRINEINKNTKEMEQSKATIEIDGQLKEVISFEVLDEKGQKKLVVVELKDGKVVLDKDGNPIYVSQDMNDDSIIIAKKGKDSKLDSKLQSQAEVKRADELKVQKGRSAERVKLNDLTRSAVKKEN